MPLRSPRPTWLHVYVTRAFSMCVHVNVKTQFKYGRNHMIVVVVVVDDDDRVLYTASRPRCHYNRLAGCDRAAVEKRSESREEKDGNAVIEQRKDRANARERIRADERG